MNLLRLVIRLRSNALTARRQPLSRLSFTLPTTLVVVLALLLSNHTASRAFAADPPTKPTAQQLQFFETKIRPVLAESCYKCHSVNAKKLKAKLLLDSLPSMIKGGEEGPALVPSKPEKSLLLAAITYKNVDLQMPPKKKLPDTVIEDFKKWIAMGAPWPKEAKPVGSIKIEGFDLKKRKAAHWSWKPINSTKPPAVKRKQWPLNPIDHFILAKLETQGLAPATQASKNALIRRLYFDLVGLPPTPAQIEAFEKDTTENAYEKVVDQLLKSPHFGEKWARHWMDLVRYAESYGHEFDYKLPHAFRYRDYLIKAYNDDVPYNQFVLEHLAGDLLQGQQQRINTSQQWNESKIGTAFWWFGEATHAPVDVKEDEAGRIDNQIDVFSRTFLGLTIACARCHDHKFDAITTKDYYAINGFLQSSRRRELSLDPQGKIATAVKTLTANQAQADAALKNIVDKPATIDIARNTKNLLAAQMVMSKQMSAADAAKKFAIALPTVENWMKALSDPLTTKTDHPLFAWHHIAINKAANTPAGFGALKTKSRAAIKTAQTRHQTANTTFPPVGDISKPDLGGWRVDGEAFAKQPTTFKQWDATKPGIQLLEGGVAHGGLRASNLRGVLHSPTFTLEKKQVWVKIKGQGVTIRLIIDGFFMEPYNGLLFRGTRNTKVNTKGKYQWIAMGGDTQRYKGHTAWLEVIDNGNGYASVADLRQGDGMPKIEQPDSIASQLLANANVTTLQKLAGALSKELATAKRSWHSTQPNNLTSSHGKLITWMIKHNIASTNKQTDIAKQFLALKTKHDQLNKQIPAPVTFLGITDGSSEDQHVFIRGKHSSLGDVAPRRLLEALYPTETIQPKVGSGRLELAHKVIAADNPYTSRVMMNRLWHHLFGRGIVPTVDDFGVMGIAPTHPQLLDWLANDFTSAGWSIKRAIKQMVMTQTYRMSSKPGQNQGKADNADPANNLLHRMRIRRLQAEAIRDSILTVSGRLDQRVGGTSVDVYLTTFMEGRGRPRSGPIDGAGRRSLYISIKRNFLPTMLTAFDFPSPFSAMGRRTTSNVPAQSLIMMNNQFVIQQTQLWAKKVLASKTTTEQRLNQMIQTALARNITPAETQQLKSFITQQAKLHGASEQDPRVWADVGHVIFNMKEFLFLN